MDDRANIRPPGSSYNSDALTTTRDEGASLDSTLSAVKREGGEQLAVVKEQAQDMMEKVGDEAKSFATEHKDAAGDQLGNVADAIATVADTLQENTNPVVAGYARDLAGGLKQASITVKSRNVDEIVGMVQDFGRQQPLAFLGAAALAGFVASRFIMSSAERTGAGATGAHPAGRAPESADRSPRSFERGEI